MYRSIASPLVANSRRAALSTRQSPSSTLLSISKYSTKTKEESAKPKKKEGTDSTHVFDPRFIGLTGDQYIPISWKNFPNPLTSPKLAYNCLARRLYNFGFNTIQVAFLRYQTGLKPKFLLWKNNSIEKYVQVNKAFAHNKIPAVHKGMSVWVERALTSRVETIPKNIKLDWKLVKFNETPKLVTFRPVMLPGKPVEYVQVVYKFNTNQELIKVNLDNEKVSKISRNVVDYVGFTVDLHTNEAILSGSAFENSPYDKIPKPEDAKQSQIFEMMRNNGDIFRLPPKSQPSNSTITSKED